MANKVHIDRYFGVESPWCGIGKGKSWVIKSVYCEDTEYLKTVNCQNCLRLYRKHLENDVANITREMASKLAKKKYKLSMIKFLLGYGGEGK